MDTYHKILLRILELTGGDETVDIDLIDLLKKEGYFPSLDNISNMLKSESWITESRPNVVRITHWGVAEAKKAGSARPDAARALEKESNKLLTVTRDFAVSIEEFIAEPTSDRRKAMEKKFSEVKDIFGKLSSS